MAANLTLFAAVLFFSDLAFIFAWMFHWIWDQFCQGFEEEFSFSSGEGKHAGGKHGKHAEGKHGKHA